MEASRSWRARAGACGFARLCPRSSRAAGGAGALSWSALLLGLGFLGGCKREERLLRVRPPEAARIEAKSLVPLAPGGRPRQSGGGGNAYEENAYAVAEGKRLYSAFNCVGCHAHGGGGMGPALMDGKWIYGAEPEQIFATIVEGRPNGMPSFRGHIADYQVWQLVAYVRSMSGLIPATAAPGRSDEMNVKPPENSVPTQPPKQSFVPPQSQ